MTIIQQIYSTICCHNRALYPDPYHFSFKSGKILQNINIFQSNYIKTSKYTWYNFLINAILIQYTRIANIYFLFICILSSIPQISPVASSTIWLPTIFVLSLSIIREGYEDYQRYKSDQILNYQCQSFCYSEKQKCFIKKYWSSIQVGDIVKILQNQFFPADLILLASSEPNGNAFIETASLDGQKNLKIRKAYNQTNKYNCQQLISTFQGQWIGTPPNNDLHRFSSKMKIQHDTIQFQGEKQFLYRGAKLKNTNWVYGMVIYTGKNTKIMMNLNSSKNKMSQIQKRLNVLLVYIFCLQVILCILPVVLYTNFRNNYQKQLYYIQWPSQPLHLDSFLMIFSYFILISTFIPISLIISIQMVKLFQAYFIQNDKLMYSNQKKKGVTVKSFSLNQQLGQIQYVFTDKTGTLTKNFMEFKIAMIGNLIYGDEQLIKRCGLGQQKSEKIINNKQLNNQLFGQKIQQQSDLTQQFFRLISMTHEVLLEKSIQNKIRYHGPSPDELALVNFAKDKKYEFVDSSQSVITISVNGKKQSFELLQTFSFSSQRKRMSIIFRDQNNKIRLYIKGADNVIRQRLSPEQSLNLDQKVNKCSSLGLRTLLLATKNISQTQYKQFKQAVSNTFGVDKQQKLQKLISKLQNDLTLIGATAVLDQLQDYVPQTIQDLITANIKVWMLTGDKLQTAQNIAKNCNLIQRQFQIFRLSQKQSFNLNYSLQKIHQQIEYKTNNKKGNALVLQGSILSNIIGNQQSQQTLLRIFQKCNSVICCRFLPLQKAQIVTLIKKKTQKIVLSIGDGQNDVPMIRAANIGIGLYGQEGMGAVQASDYCLPQFRMLRRLMFVHGRWNYIRVSQMILYFFYKNIIFTVPRLVFGFNSGYSAQRVFDDAYVALYNAVFTAWPLIIRAVLEQDVNYIFPVKRYSSSHDFQQIDKSNSSDIIPVHILNDHPEQANLPPGYKINKYFYNLFPKIYLVGQKNQIFNRSRFIVWVSQAMILGVLITWINFQVVDHTSINQNGWNSDLWLASLSLFSSLMLIVTLKLFMHTKYVSWYFVFGIIILSIVPYIAYMIFSNYKGILNKNILGTVQIMSRTMQILFYLIFCACLIIIIDNIHISYDYQYGQHVSKMRLAVSQEKQDNIQYLKLLNLPVQQNEKIQTLELQTNIIKVIQT